MNEELVIKETIIPDYVVKELQGIIFKYRRHKSRCSEETENTYLKSFKRKDPESFQNEYEMSKYPGDIEEAKLKKKNNTIKQIYLQHKNKELDWLFLDMYKSPYILEKYGLGVPLFFTMMKMILFILYLLFFINLYTGFQLFETCKDPKGCITRVAGGLVLIDIIQVPKTIMSSISFVIWIVFSYVLQIYIHRICDQDDSIRQTEVDKSNQLILKYFLKGLNKGQVEQALFQRLNQYCNKMQISLMPNVNINLLEVTPITNHYKISLKINQINKLYMKIIKAIQKIDPILMIPQNRISKKSQKFGSISTKNINQQQDNIEQIEKQNKSIQINNFPNQQNEQETNYTKGQAQIDLNPSSNNQDTQGSLNMKEDQYRLSKDLNNNEQEEIPNQRNQIAIEEDVQNKEEHQNSNNGNFMIKEFFLEFDDFLEQKMKLEQCEAFLKQNHKKMPKLIKQLKKYNDYKCQLLNEYQSPEVLSSSYIIKCQSIQQKNMILMFLRPQNCFVSFFQKLKYIFRNKNSQYSLDRYFPKNSTHLNINWQTIGIELKKKLLKQIIVMILGTFQFVLSSLLLYILYIWKINQEESKGGGISNYFFKGLIALSQSVFYLISEKIFELYSFHMVTSLKSNKISMITSNMFYFYALSYIWLPLISMFLFGLIAYSYSLQQEYSNNPYYEVELSSPFKLFVINFIIGSAIFSVKVINYQELIKKINTISKMFEITLKCDSHKIEIQQISSHSFLKLLFTIQIIKFYFYQKQSIIPFKFIKRKMLQWYYIKSTRFLKKTQYELNKIYQRQKFRLQDTTMALFNILIISIPFTFSLPVLLIVPILLLTVMYFAFKYHYLVLFRPIYYCKTIHKKTSTCFAKYIQRVSFFSYLFFAKDIFICISAVTFYITLFFAEIGVSLYYQHNFKQQKATRFQFINQMESHYQTQNAQKLNQQLNNAVEQYQQISQSQSSFSSSNMQGYFYFNQQQMQNNLHQQEDVEKQSEFFSNSQSNFQLKKRQIYSFERAYHKYKFIQDQQKDFHCNSNSLD